MCESGLEGKAGRSFFEGLKEGIFRHSVGNFFMDYEGNCRVWLKQSTIFDPKTRRQMTTTPRGREEGIGFPERAPKISSVLGKSFSNPKIFQIGEPLFFSAQGGGCFKAQQ